MTLDDLPYLPYFSHDLLAHDWPPGFLPRETDKAAEDNARRLAAHAITNRLLRVGWAKNGGTVEMPGTPTWTQPGWMR